MTGVWLADQTTCESLLRGIEAEREVDRFQWSGVELRVCNFIPKGKTWYVPQPAHKTMMPKILIPPRRRFDDEPDFYFGMGFTTPRLVPAISMIASMPSSEDLGIKLPWYWRLWKWWTLLMYEIKWEADKLLDGK